MSGYDDAPARPSLPPVPSWLDEVEGERALAWVAEHNAATRAAVEGTERFETIRTEIEAILDSSDRIPHVVQAAGRLYNFWTDADHPHGLWRRTTWESYRAGGPLRAGGTASAATTQWETLIDLDDLGRSEGTTWVWHGAQVLRTGPLAGRRALVDLSDGGSDTDVTREVDLDTGRFIPPAEGGFHREASKGALAWADDAGDRVLAVVDAGEGSLSPAGYPRQVRRLRRGQSPAEGEVLLTAAADDDGAWAHRDRWGRTWLLTRPDFYTEELWLLPDGARTLPPSAGPIALAEDGTTVAPGAVHIDVPSSARATAVWDWLLISLREDWEVGGVTHPAGSLVAAPLTAFLAGQGRIGRAHV